MKLMERTQLPNLETIVDRFFSEFPFGIDIQLPRLTAPLPPLDVYENAGTYVVELAVPGYLPKDIKVEVTGSTLTIYGAYVINDDKAQAKYHHREIRRGSFQRTVTLPQELNPEAVTAKVENGFLIVTLAPKTPIAAKAIPVLGV
jgi:HSP20 family protein